MWSWQVGLPLSKYTSGYPLSTKDSICLLQKCSFLFLCSYWYIFNFFSPTSKGRAVIFLYPENELIKLMQKYKPFYICGCKLNLQFPGIYAIQTDESKQRNEVIKVEESLISKGSCFKVGEIFLLRKKFPRLILLTLSFLLANSNWKDHWTLHGEPFLIHNKTN